MSIFYFPDAFQTLCFLPAFQMDLREVEYEDLFKTGDDSRLEIALKKLYREESFGKDMKKMLVSLDNLGAFD